MKLLLTGGCGFIGSAVVRHLLRHSDHVVINVDKLTYAASEEALEEARGPRPPRADPCRHRRRRRDAPDLRGAPARRCDASRGRKPCRSLDRRAGGLHPDQCRRHLHPARGGAGVSRDARPARGARLPVSSRLDGRGVRRARPRRCAVRRRPRRTTRAAPTRRARRRRTIWCAPGSTPIGCRRSSPTPPTTTARGSSRRS